MEGDVGELDDRAWGSRRASERLPERRQVLAHHREVGRAGLDPALAQPLERIEERGLDPGLRATVCASFGEISGSKKTVVVPELRTVSTSRAMSFADGSASGVRPSSGTCTRP